MNHVDTSLDKSKFTNREEIELLKTTVEVGYGKWHDITDELNLRTGK